MSFRMKSVVAGAAVLATTGGVLLLGATPALAAAPPYEPDANSLGRVVFYDAQGHVLTGGSNLQHIADYVATTTADTTGSTKATFFFAAPDHNQPDTSQWATFDQSLSTTYPNASAPAPIKGPGFTNPVVTLGSGDADFADTVGGVAQDTTTGYANIFQVRVYSTKSSPKYWESDIQVNQATGTWQVVDPSIATTTTSISGNPAGGSSSPGTLITPGSSLPLSATVAPAKNGTVQFFDGTTAVGSPQTVTTSNGTATVTDTPAAGNHSYSAVFTPDGGTEVVGSASPTIFYQAKNLFATHVALSVNPASAPQYSNAVLTADITNDNTNAAAGNVGTVTFTATPSGGGAATTLGTQSTNDGTAGEYKLSYSVTLAQGDYNLNASFAPSDTADYAPSATAAPTAFTVTAAQCPGSPANQDPSSPYFGAAAGQFPTCSNTANIEVTVSPGSLTISTPYTSSNPFVLPVMKLNPAGTLLSSSAAFPSAGQYITVTSTLAGDPNWTVSVTASDLVGQASTSHVINGENVGLTAGALANGASSSLDPKFPGSVAFTDNAAAPGATPSDTGSAGLKNGPHTFAVSSGGGNGTAQMTGTLTVNAPTQTVADTYDGTIVFSVA